MLDRLQEAILATGCPVTIIRQLTATSGEVIPDPSATPQQVSAANTALANFDWSVSAHAAWMTAKQVAAAKSYVDANNDLQNKAILALASLTLDEINRHAQKWNDYRAQVAAATSLANLQSRVAALGDLPTYTLQQLITAIKNKVS